MLWNCQQNRRNSSADNCVRRSRAAAGVAFRGLRMEVEAVVRCGMTAHCRGMMMNYWNGNWSCAGFRPCCDWSYGCC